LLTPKEILEKLKVCQYRYNEDIKPELGGKQQIGLIAQDLLEAFSDQDYDFVREREGYYQVNYTQFISVLISVVKDQEKRITELERKLEDK